MIFPPNLCLLPRWLPDGCQSSKMLPESLLESFLRASSDLPGRFLESFPGEHSMRGSQERFPRELPRRAFQKSIPGELHRRVYKRVFQKSFPGKLSKRAFQESFPGEPSRRAFHGSFPGALLREILQIFAKVYLFGVSRWGHMIFCSYISNVY